MRRIVDIAALLVVAAVVVGVLWLRTTRQREVDLAGVVAGELARFQQEVLRRAATGAGDVNARGWPVTINPDWFGGRPPQNGLLSPDRPWVEVATPEQAHLMHPEVRLAIDRSLAAFWYNPYQGVVRTRVPAAVSDQGSLELYNRLNRCALASIFQAEPGPHIEPVAPAPADGSAHRATAEADQAEPE
jgi:hypothetical protein